MAVRGGKLSHEWACVRFAMIKYTYIIRKLLFYDRHPTLLVTADANFSKLHFLSVPVVNNLVLFD